MWCMTSCLVASLCACKSSAHLSWLKCQVFVIPILSLSYANIIWVIYNLNIAQFSCWKSRSCLHLHIMNLQCYCICACRATLSWGMCPGAKYYAQYFTWAPFSHHSLLFWCICHVMRYSYMLVVTILWYLCFLASQNFISAKMQNSPLFHICLHFALAFCIISFRLVVVSVFCCRRPRKPCLEILLL